MAELLFGGGKEVTAIQITGVTIGWVGVSLVAMSVILHIRQWRKLGERIQPPVVWVSEREYTPAPKPAPTIVAMSRREPMRGKRPKTRKQERRRRVWDEQARGDY